MHLPAVLVTAVYLAALAVAVREPSEHLLAGAFVLLAVLTRPAVRSAGTRVLAAHRVRGHRRAAAVALVDEPAVAPVTPA